MTKMTSIIKINVDTQIKNEATIPFEIANQTPSKYMLEALEEINEMINNPEKYPRYNNSEDLKNALLSDN